MFIGIFLVAMTGSFIYNHTDKQRYLMTQLRDGRKVYMPISRDLIAKRQAHVEAIFKNRKPVVSNGWIN